MKKILLLTAAILLSACSEKAVYDNIQLNNRLQCDKVPLSEYCLLYTSPSPRDRG